MSFVFPSNQSLLISGVIHGTEQTERLVFDGMCVWMINDVIRLKFSCLFVCLIDLILNVPVNNISVTSGRVFLD